MKQKAALESIEREIERLAPEEQLRLVEKLARNLRRIGIHTGKGLDWSEIYGLGKGVWEGEDAQSYVGRLREERE